MMKIERDKGDGPRCNLLSFSRRFFIIIVRITWTPSLRTNIRVWYESTVWKYYSVRWSWDWSLPLWSRPDILRTAPPPGCCCCWLCWRGCRRSGAGQGYPANFHWWSNFLTDCLINWLIDCLSDCLISRFAALKID